jgi:hypothetical protein
MAGNFPPSILVMKKATNLKTLRFKDLKSNKLEVYQKNSSNFKTIFAVFDDKSLN